ncbi:MerR family transcriptional regulator [Streptacidiphilus sp. P02-A3a]|uniref:helix-turn-helix domain-containing protein n=1 Tax=Streptacidiphilus sp. P02-A3a TaxID=2704468 RepID=UPI002107DCE9|nr:MerR family transcriptional regulator [Streptacidiphilus sp. P02-A3a]
MKTVRFWSDQGLLPEVDRSSGGHRRYAPEAVERLRLIRSLRTLDMPLPAVARVLDGEADEDLHAAVATQLGTVTAELTALRWREAALRLLHEAAPDQRVELLRLVGALGARPSTDTFVRYWRRLLPTRLSVRLTTAIIDSAVPPLPVQPSPQQVLAFARLHALTGAVTDACLVDHRPVVPRPDVLYDGLSEAYELAVPALRAGCGPAEGEALDCFVAAYARSYGQSDTPAVRRDLGRALARGEHPAMRRYWQLAGDLTPQPTLGAAHAWLSSALSAQLAAEAD